jgi:methylated-DNA-[protein]-cysteine S-methyltransferase
VNAHGYALFDTEIGRCGIAWSDRGVVAVQLPDQSEDGTRRRLTRRSREAPEATPPPAVQRAVDSIVALLDGGTTDLLHIELDMEDVPSFDRRVYEVARTVPPGETITYGEIAARLGAPGEARAVGSALARNPFAIVVPCHRVLAAGGNLGGFSATGGVRTKRGLLSIEGAPVANVLTLFDDDAV